MQAHKYLSLALLGGSLICTPLVASAGGNQANQAGGTQATGTTAGTDGATIKTGGKTTSMNDAFKNMSAADLVGKTIYDQQGQAVGQIDAVIVKGENQKFPVVSVGQYLAVGERRVMVPPSHFDTSDPSKITLRMSRADMEKQQEMKDQNVWSRGQGMSGSAGSGNSGSGNSGSGNSGSGNSGSKQ